MTPECVWELTVSRAITETIRTLGPETPEDVLAGAAILALGSLPPQFAEVVPSAQWGAAFDRVLGQVLAIESLLSDPEIARRTRQRLAARRAERRKN